MMTEIIDRYVFAVTRYLPTKQRADVTEELSSSLLDELENRFGREATDDDLVTMLKEMGPPETVAASYRPSSQYLIGPKWYPAFRRTLKIVIPIEIVVLAAYVVMSYLRGTGVLDAGEAFDPLDAIFTVFGLAFDIAIYTVGIIVLVFVGLERSDSEAEPEPEWDPRTLPAPYAEEDTVDRLGSIVAIVLQFLFLGALLRYRDQIGFVVVPGEPPLLNDIVQANLPWITAVLVLGIAHAVYLLWRGSWSVLSRAADFFLDLAGLFILWWIATDIRAATDDLLAAGLDERLVELIHNVTIGSPIVVFLLIIVGHSQVLYRMVARAQDSRGLVHDS
ncbi:MAG: hypothetical protein AAGD38_17610 [Acidobacteriota bacterium]